MSKKVKIKKHKNEDDPNSHHCEEIFGRLDARSSVGLRHLPEIIKRNNKNSLESEDVKVSDAFLISIFGDDKNSKKQAKQAESAKSSIPLRPKSAKPSSSSFKATNQEPATHENGKTVSFADAEQFTLEKAKTFIRLRPYEIPETLTIKFCSLLKHSKWTEASKVCRKLIVLNPENKNYRDFLILLQSLIILKENMQAYKSRSVSVKSETTDSSHTEPESSNKTSLENELSLLLTDELLKKLESNDANREEVLRETLNLIKKKTLVDNETALMSILNKQLESKFELIKEEENK